MSEDYLKDIENGKEDEIGIEEFTGEAYFCLICLESKSEKSGFRLNSCHHIFCRKCFLGYLQANINDGTVHLKCFSTEVPQFDLNSNTGSSSSISSQCNVDIYHEDIVHLFEEEGDSTTLEKYKRFKFAKENKTARECPHCSSLEIADYTISPKVKCSQCQHTFCYFHSNAHDFDKFPTCAEYEKFIEDDMKASMAEVSKISKPCPSCTMPVMKSGGCNHMKCQCGAAFCWLCGKEIEDTLFPAHFQWWNPSGCSNLQMNEASEPTPGARFCARVLSFCEILVLGPLTLISTLASSLLCCSCIMLKLSADPKLGLIRGNRNVFSSCMSIWGLVWMSLLFILPAAICFGSVAAAFFAVVAVLVLPCWAYTRFESGRGRWRSRQYWNRHFFPVNLNEVAARERSNNIFDENVAAEAISGSKSIEEVSCEREWKDMNSKATTSISIRPVHQQDVENGGTDQTGMVDEIVAERATNASTPLKLEDIELKTIDF